MVIDPTKINHEIFRIKGLLLEIIVSEQLKNKLENLKLSEIVLTPIEEFVWKNNQILFKNWLFLCYINPLVISIFKKNILLRVIHLSYRK